MGAQSKKNFWNPARDELTGRAPPFWPCLKNGRSVKLKQTNFQSCIKNDYVSLGIEIDFA